jgi:hypothetical protein
MKTMNANIHPPTTTSAAHRHEDGRQPTRRHRLSVNITPPERIGRVAIGLVAVIAGAILLTSVLAVTL